MLKPSAVAAVVTVACLALGCPQSPPQDARDAQESVAPATVIMLEAGQDPLAVRDYDVPAGLSLGGSFMVIEFRILQDGEKLPAPRDRAMRIVLDGVRTTAEANGTGIEIATEPLPPAQSEPNRTESVQAAAAETILSRPLHRVVGPQGSAAAAVVPDGRALDDAGVLPLAGVVDALFRPVPFPSEPIGLGALWESHRELVVAGVRLTETARYRITQLARDQMRLSFHLRQTAAPQTVARDSGDSIAVKSHQVEIEGAAVIDLRLPMPMDVDAGLSATTVSTSPTPDSKARVERQTAELRLFVHTPEAGWVDPSPE